MSIADIARANILSFLSLVEPQLSSNIDLFKLIMDTPNQTFFQPPKEEMSTANAYWEYLNFLRVNVSAGDLIADTIDSGETFFIAHRGSRDDYPEHTMLAWENSLKDGAQAIEISLVVTSDDVVVGHHDLTVDRMTAGTGAVNTFTYANLPAIDDSLWTGPGWGEQPWARLEDILTKLAGRAILFIEPKAAAAHTPLMNALDLIPNATNTVIYKAYKWGTNQDDAKARGYKVWSYVDADTTTTETQTIITNGADYIGCPRRDDQSSAAHMSDALLQDTIALGVPVIVWEVHRKWAVDYMEPLGVQGFMCSAWNHVNKTSPIRSVDLFSNEKRDIGDLPRTYTNTFNPVFRAVEDSIALETSFGQTFMLGSLSYDTPLSSYEVLYEMAYDTIPDDGNTHCGAVFGKLDDSFYIFSSTLNAVGGYHIVFRSDGRVQLYRHDPGVSSGTQLGSIATTAPVADTWIPFRIEVTPTSLSLERTDVAMTPVESSDTTYRGGYLHVARNFDLDAPSNRSPIRFRNVQVRGL